MILALALAACGRDPAPEALRRGLPSLPASAFAVAAGPLPDVCRPWRPSPEAVPLPEAENPVFEGRKGRKFCYKRGPAGPGEDPAAAGETWCDAWSELNMHWFASAHLYPLGPEGERLPYGSSTGCNGPVTAATVKCYAELNNVHFKTVERVLVECRGDRFCGRSRSAECCRVTAREKVDPPIGYEPTRDDTERWERERCGRLRHRRETCKPYCTSQRWSGQCAGYWNYVDPTCRTVPRGT